MHSEELESAKKETADVLEAAEILEKEMNELREERDQYKLLSESSPGGNS